MMKWEISGNGLMNFLIEYFPKLLGGWQFKIDAKDGALQKVTPLGYGYVGYFREVNLVHPQVVVS